MERGYSHMTGIFTRERFCYCVQTKDIIPEEEAAELIRGRLYTVDDDALECEIRKTQVSKFSEK